MVINFRSVLNFRSANFTIIWLKSPLSKTINRKWHFLRLIVWKRLLPRLIIVETYSSPKKVQAQLFSERPPLRPKIQNSVFLRTWLFRQYVSHIWSFSGSSSQWTSFLFKKFVYQLSFLCFTLQRSTARANGVVRNAKLN